MEREHVGSCAPAPQFAAFAFTEHGHTDWACSVTSAEATILTLSPAPYQQVQIVSDNISKKLESQLDQTFKSSSHFDKSCNKNYPLKKVTCYRNSK